MSTAIAKPAKVAIIGASGTYGKGILARAKEIGVEVVLVTRSPHKFKDVKPTTTVVEAQLDEEEKLQKAFAGCAGVISALGELEQNEWERDSLLMRENGANGITWVLTRPVRPTQTPFVGAHVHKNKRGPMNCSIYDHGDFCLYCVASSEWDKLAPHVSSGPQPKKT